ncbi:hypothetical protein F441_07214 [Phytophthora nicotianae CJ01A1]|uniref:HAT C-terminal dimerisation domain-containing protein n=2 Tax=Phytophthora nicotianae TaxID=4792 RepID=W2X6X7_PHYNI|nr:hypothetical protein F441_07214 [Phytophthora nicotianae CJ01A1]
MVKRFLEFKDAVKHVEAVNELMPRARDCRKLEKQLEDLKALGSVCLALQFNKTTLSDVRIMFDGVIKRYPNMAKYLSKDANIVHSPAFESAVVKIMHQERLSRLETPAIASFQVGESSASEPEEANASSFAATLLHAGNKRNYATANAPQYDSLLFHVPPTSNDCERLFSNAKAVMTPQRSSMLPINFEMIMFLKENASYWGRRTVATVQHRSADSNANAPK